jgi:UDP-N-acetylmuramoylalanine--D-glutamate ligase
LIGESAGKIAGDLGAAVLCIPAGALERAVEMAAERARPGDTILLAPACSSFDQFENYEQRGRAFKQLVLQLKEQATDQHTDQVADQLEKHSRASAPAHKG